MTTCSPRIGLVGRNPLDSGHSRERRARRRQPLLPGMAPRDLHRRSARGRAREAPDRVGEGAPGARPPPPRGAPVARAHLSRHGWRSGPRGLRRPHPRQAQPRPALVTCTTSFRNMPIGLTPKHSKMPSIAIRTHGPVAVTTGRSWPPAEPSVPFPSACTSVIGPSIPGTSFGANPIGIFRKRPGSWSSDRSPGGGMVRVRAAAP